MSQFAHPGGCLCLCALLLCACLILSSGLSGSVCLCGHACVENITLNQTPHSNRVLRIIGHWTSGMTFAVVFVWDETKSFFYLLRVILEGHLSPQRLILIKFIRRTQTVRGNLQPCATGPSSNCLVEIKNQDLEAKYIYSDLNKGEIFGVQVPNFECWKCVLVTLLSLSLVFVPWVTLFYYARGFGWLDSQYLRCIMFYESFLWLIVRNWAGLEVCAASVDAQTPTKNFILGNNKWWWKLMEIITAAHAVEQTAIILQETLHLHTRPARMLTKINGWQRLSLTVFKGRIFLLLNVI